MAPRRRAVTATDLDTLADRFRVDMIHIFMFFLILKKRDYISMALISFRRTTLRVMSWKKKIDRNGSNPLSIIVIFNLFYVRKAGFFFRNMDILSLK